ncbi:CAP domain-containing protein [Prosthecomicrobium sp. N25]|uniref:CAP domain-containing protein n=1 Tax=Prosthecomicrobium sp. N25 TaxID=3129254 RepID=UPI0030778515
MTPPIPAPTRRLVLRGLSLAGVSTGLSACGMLSDITGPKITIDASRPYKPVDPERAVATINAYRAKSGVGPLAHDPKLTAAARTYARHMAEADKMSHALSPWGPLDKRLRDAGYAYATAGENLGVGYRDLEDAFEGWRRSPAHDRGMKDPDMTVMGIASEYRPDSGWKTFWCLMFARPREAGAPVARGGPFSMGL